MGVVLAGLVALLKDDVIAYSDGGGKTYAALNPIYGADKVSRFLIAISRRPLPGTTGGYFTEVNGTPGFVVTLDEKMISVVTIDVDEQGQIDGIFIVVNPEKLVSA